MKCSFAHGEIAAIYELRANTTKEHRQKVLKKTGMFTFTSEEFGIGSALLH